MKLRIPVLAALIALLSVFGASQADAQVRATVRIGQPAYGYRPHYRPHYRPYAAPRRVVVYQPVRPRRYYARPMPPRRVYVQPVPRRGNYGYGYRYHR